MISVIIPANNEGPLIGHCLSALFASDAPEGEVEVLVVANGCTDDTVAQAQAFAPNAQEKGWAFRVIDLPQGGKMLALNEGDAQAQGDMRAYLDADVELSAPVLAQLVHALSPAKPLYASGKVTIPQAQSWATRAYGRFYLTVPFMRHGVPGCGLFAVNAEGRKRWAQFPNIISDDTYVRLSFSPEERLSIDASYRWPLVEGFGNLVKVRRRQNLGVTEIKQTYPELLENDDKFSYGKQRLIGTIIRDPIGFAVYAAVALRVKLGRNSTRWSRGR
ncbi:MAG: glycosyltransferase [Thalassovita sp.]